MDTVTEELLAKMKAAGCNGLLFGVESANAEILRIIDKKITTEQVENAARICTDAGITPCMSFILGLPGETPQSVRESQEFGERLKSLGAMYGFHFLAPFPGTKVREESDSYGLKILSNDWKEYHANRAIVETESVSQAHAQPGRGSVGYRNPKILRRSPPKLRTGRRVRRNKIDHSRYGSIPPLFTT